MYKFIRSFLFCFGPEWIHSFSMGCLRVICHLPGGKKLLRTFFRPSNENSLSTRFLELTFDNPVGLGAGFDKNARYLRELEVLGFGFVEIGTVTPLPQPGNDKPRLFRLPEDKALINRMGFNNEGATAAGERLKKWRETSNTRGNGLNGRIPNNTGMIIGGNIGKNKITPNEHAWKDYLVCFKVLHAYVDYFVVNVSSPNTPGLRELQEKESLRKILTSLQKENLTYATRKPILLKIAPDLSTEQIDDVVELALEIKLDGLVASNTTIHRTNLQTADQRLKDIGTGGLSGFPLKQRNTQVIQYIHQKTNGELPIIASGGIFNGPDAKEKLISGATLVQVWTGFVYEGPGIVRQICKFL